MDDVTAALSRIPYRVAGAAFSACPHGDQILRTVNHVFITLLHAAGYPSLIEHGDDIEHRLDSGVPFPIDGRESVRHPGIGKDAFKRDMPMRFLERDHRLHRPGVDADGPAAEKMRHSVFGDQAVACAL